MIRDKNELINEKHERTNQEQEHNKEMNKRSLPIFLWTD